MPTTYLIVQIEDRFYWRIEGEDPLFNRGPFRSQGAARAAAEIAFRQAVNKLMAPKHEQESV